MDQQGKPGRVPFQFCPSRRQVRVKRCLFLGVGVVERDETGLGFRGKGQGHGLQSPAAVFRRVQGQQPTENIIYRLD